MESWTMRKQMTERVFIDRIHVRLKVLRFPTTCHLRTWTELVGRTKPDSGHIHQDER